MPTGSGRPPMQAATGTAEAKRTTSTRTITKTTPTTTTSDQQATTSGTLTPAERRSARKSDTTETIRLLQVTLNEASDSSSEMECLDDNSTIGHTSDDAAIQKVSNHNRVAYWWHCPQPVPVTAANLKAKEERVPPVDLREKARWTTLNTQIFRRGIRTTKVVNTNVGIHIQPATANDYRQLVQAIAALKMQFHSYLLTEDTPLKVVLRGVPEDIAEDELNQDLAREGIRVLTKEVFKFTHVCGINVTVESKLVKKDQITQCHRCQLYGHGQRNCHAAAVCVKCAGPHPTAECTKRRDAPAKCALCPGSSLGKYESGFDKQKKKLKRDNFLESQTGALVKFLKPIGDEVDDYDVTQTHDDVSDEITPSTSSIHGQKTNSDINESLVDQTTVGSISVDAIPVPVKTISRTTESCNSLNSTGRFELLSDACDPALCKSTDKAFCFCCKLYGNDTGSQLANEEYSDWAHLGRALDNHEKSAIHGQNVGKWTDSEIRLAEASTIDKQHMKLINKEKEHWREVVKRIVSGIKYLAQRNIALRGSNSKLYEPNNSNFLGLIEMMATFDPVMQEHLRRIRSFEIHDHYLGANIQNELIKLLSEKVKEEIVSDIKAAKYFSVLLDCTPDLSHQEQLSLVIRFVKTENSVATKNKIGFVTVEEHFLEFLDVKSTTGTNLTDVLLEELDKICLVIKDCRGQGYDNGSNMKGWYSEVQARTLEINQRAFCMPYASRSLNLLICDAAKCSPKAITFFGIDQRIYVVFSASMKR
ncbi:hypothetical protein Trydic_g23026 [Trypoxylus dichotomus]